MPVSTWYYLQLSVCTIYLWNIKISIHDVVEYYFYQSLLINVLYKSCASLSFTQLSFLFCKIKWIFFFIWLLVYGEINKLADQSWIYIRLIVRVNKNLDIIKWIFILFVYAQYSIDSKRYEAFGYISIHNRPILKLYLTNFIAQFTHFR